MSRLNGLWHLLFSTSRGGGRLPPMMRQPPQESHRIQINAA
jgi:hypothetical protein